MVKDKVQNIFKLILIAYFFENVSLSPPKNAAFNVSQLLARDIIRRPRGESDSLTAKSEREFVNECTGTQNTLSVQVIDRNSIQQGYENYSKNCSKKRGAKSNKDNENQVYQKDTNNLTNIIPPSKVISEKARDKNDTNEKSNYATAFAKLILWAFGIEDRKITTVSPKPHFHILPISSCKGKKRRRRQY